ncbi:MAG: potassium-transporting ATPase subunit KdpA [Candidatus Sericytochromatia bacterium]
MIFRDFLQLILYFIILTLTIKPLGLFMAKVYMGEKTVFNIFLEPVENFIYKLCSINKNEEHNWKEYTFSLLLFNFLGFVVLFFIQIFQQNLPLNPENIKNVPWDLSLNTAISFVTNTNWQSYSGEAVMSYFTQMVGLVVQNFLSAATGMVVMVVLARSLSKKSEKKLGNFWVDITKTILYILMPLSIIFSVFLVSEGVVQNFSSYQKIVTLEGVEQVVPQGPAASQIAIKQIGTNGGGFFGVNSAHPLENPTPITNFFEMLAILLLPASLTYTYGVISGSIKQGKTLFLTMFILLTMGLGISLFYEYSNNPIFNTAFMMEGKETRFGVTNSVLWSVVTTAASNGSVNAMHDSLSPISGMIGMLNIMIGEIVFGGVGAGIYGIFIFILLTVFIAGLMVGRTPEYLGKKIEAFEIKMAMIAVLLPSFVILVFSAIACTTEIGLSSLGNKGPHGLSEIIYNFSSAAGNNGSAFAGLNTNTIFYNLMIALGMLIGRFGVIIPVMAIAGSLVGKNITPKSEGTLSTESALFIFLLISVILIIGALTFFPALALAPIVEHFLMLSNISF